MCLQRLRPKAEALHYPGPETFHQHVGSGGKRRASGAAILAPDVHGEHAASAVGDRVGPAVPSGPVDSENLGTQIRKQHGAMGARPYPGELDDAEARERAVG
jgi:hypothetical protein